MSIWSAISSYPTAGQPPKPMSIASEQAPAARKQKKEKGKKVTQQQQQASLSPEEEAQMVKVCAI